MNETALFLHQLIGPIGLVMSIGLLVNGKFYKELMEKMDKEPLGWYLGGLMALTLGMAIVLTHNLWTTPQEIIISLLGWLSLAKGVLLTTTHMSMKNLAKKISPYRTVGAVLWLALGGYMTYVGYFMT